MAAVIKTVVTYPLNGSIVDFNIPFEYLARKFVTVTLIGETRKELVLNQDYRFTTKNQVTTTKAWGPADGYTLIEVRRFTSATDRLVDFADGSILRAYDLNISQVQTLHVAEEARDLTADTIGVNNDGNLDARGRRIVNVADPVDDFDALNLGTVKAWNNSAYQSYVKAQQEADRSRDEADRSKREADRAAQQATAAAGSASAALTSENNSKTSETNAKTSEGNAAGSSQAAKTSETNAKFSENAAFDSRTKAEAARDKAIEEANKLENNNKLAGAVDSINEAQAVKWKGAQLTPYVGITNKDGLTAYAIKVDGGVLSFDYNESTDKYINMLGITLQPWKLRAIGGTVAVVTGDNAREMNFGFVNDASTVQYNYSGGVNRIDFNGLLLKTASSFHTVGTANGRHADQGAHFCWNESGDGKGSIVVNRGGGSGGFKFRFVNQNNTVQTGGVDIDGDGTVNASGNVKARYTVYSGNGAAALTTDGNLQGPIWGGFLSNWISNNAMSDAGRGGQQFRPGAMQTAWEAPAGCFLTGTNTNYNDGRILGSYYRQLIGRKINGGQFGLGDF